MIMLPDSILQLINSLKKLPGVGSKTAERLAYFIYENEKSYCDEFSNNLSILHDSIDECDSCFFFVEKGKNCICKGNRDKSIICVVQKPKDVIAFESTGFMGLYHVLGGVLSPLDQIGPDDLHIKELFNRIDENINEVILAMDTSLEGDATSIYISDQLDRLDLNIKITRLARGIPIGGQFEFIDEITLARAFDERTEF